LEIYENGEGEQLIELKQAITSCKVKMTKDSTKAHPQNPCKKMIVEKKKCTIYFRANVRNGSKEMEEDIVPVSQTT
jgi:hypothetical protein